MSKSLNLYDGVKADWPFGAIPGFKTYLDEVWQNRPLFLTNEDDEEEIRSREQQFFIFKDGKVKPRNYVGFVQYADLRINIYPRVFYKRAGFNPEVDASLAINHVLKWLSYGNRIHFPFSELDTALKKQDDWLEALIYLFANYTFDALTTSPYFAYQELTDEMAFVRGRIAMQPYMNRNLARGRHHVLHCTYEPFLYDNQFNRIVKYTCRLLQSVTTNNLNRLYLNDIVFLLDEVADIYCTAEDCSKVQVNRLYQEVGIINNMCAAFLSHQAYNDGLLNNQNLCILSPMEVIYEQYIAGFIQEHFPELKSRAQASDEYVAMTGKNLDKPVFQMRHDILLKDKLIIDTKYKFRYKENDHKAGVSQNDIYQMVTYCYKREMRNGMLLYPHHFEDAAENDSKNFKVKDVMITAASIDITENDFENFEENQRMKLEKILLTPALQNL